MKDDNCQGDLFLHAQRRRPAKRAHRERCSKPGALPPTSPSLSEAQHGTGQDDERTVTMSAKVICFPLDKKIGKARHVAWLYLKKRTDRERQSDWATIVAGLANSMAKAGFDEAEIDVQLELFRAAVEWEIGTISAYNDRKGPAA